MTIYEIDQAIESLVDLETGELLDYDAFAALQMERDSKIENMSCWVVNLSAEVAALKAQEDVLAKRRKAAEKKAENLKDYLTAILGGEKFKSDRVAVSFRRSQSVEITDENAVPKTLWNIKTTATPDKTAIAKLLKEGQEVPGCVLAEKLNIGIK